MGGPQQTLRGMSRYFPSSGPEEACRKQNWDNPVFVFWLMNVTEGQREKGFGRRVVRIPMKPKEKSKDKRCMND